MSATLIRHYFDAWDRESFNWKVVRFIKLREERKRHFKEELREKNVRLREVRKEISQVSYFDRIIAFNLESI